MAEWETISGGSGGGWEDLPEQKNIVSRGLDKVGSAVQESINYMPDTASIRPTVETAVGFGENMLQMATGGIGQVAGGLAGLLGGGTLDERVQRVGNVSDALTYKPRTDIGSRGSENIQNVFEAGRTGSGNITDTGPVGRTLGEFGFDALTQVAPVAAGLKGARAQSRAAREAQAKQATSAKQAFDDLELVKKQQEDVSKPLEYEKVPIEPEIRRGATGWEKDPTTVDMEFDPVRQSEKWIADRAKKHEAYIRQQQLADLEARRARNAQEVPPMDVPPTETFQKGLELNQRGGPTETWDLGKGEVPKWSTAEGANAFRGRDVFDVPMDPLQRATAVDLISDPRHQKNVRQLEKVSKQLTDEIAKYNDPVIQRGLEMNEALGLNKAATITKNIERLTNEQVTLQAKVMAQTEWAGEIATRRPAVIEKTPGWDGPQQTIRVSFWDKLSELGSEVISRANRGSRGPMGRQRGVINTDLLTLGVPTLIKSVGESSTLKKFVGTFTKDILGRAIRDHFTPTHKNKLGWISPEAFHDLAKKRSPSYMSPKGSVHGGSAIPRYESIEKGLAGAGLDDLPTLWLGTPRISQGRLAFDVMGHEGRHRMDVANRYGLEQMPVIWRMSDDARAAMKKAQENGTPIELLAEDHGAVIEFPGLMELDPYEFGRKLPPNQAGAADVRLVTAIATAGISELVRGGLKAAARLREGSNKRSMPQQTPNKVDPSPQGILDAAAGETRDLETWKATQDLTKLKDIDGIVTEGVGNWANGNFLAQFSDSPLVKYVVDKINNNLRIGHLNAKLVKDSTVGKRAANNSPTAKLDALTRADKELFNEIADRYAGRYQLSSDEIRTLGGSERVVEAYAAVRKAYDKMLDDVNKVRTEPMAKLPGYIHRLREGDFKLDVIDPKTGEKVWSDLFNNRLSRVAVERGLRAKFGPEYEYTKSMLDRDTRGNPYNTSTVPFEELMRAVAKADPRRGAIESVAREHRSKRGFGRHAIQRKHITGKDFDVAKGFEQFTDSAYNYIANMENKSFVKDLAFDPDINAPKIKGWAQTYNDLASGGFKPGAIIDSLSKWGEGLWQVATLGNSGPSGFHNALRLANNVFMAKALFVWRPVFAGVQAAQPFQFIPQHLAHMKTQGFDASAIKAMYQGEKVLVDWLAGRADPDFLKFMKEYQIPRGNIDPTMIEAMNIFGKSKIKDWALGTPPLQAIESFGRLQSSAIAYQFFKNAGLKGKDLFMEAENFTNRVMVDYSKQERPAIVGKTGLFGTAAGPLSTFATNFWTSTLMFMQDIAKNPGKPGAYAPMGIHLAQTALWGGLTGMLGVDLVDKFIQMLRWGGIVGPKTKTLSEMVMTNEDIPDVMTFGVPSHLLDMNVSGSFASPEMRGPSANTFPGISLIAEAMATMGPILKGTDTKADRQKMLKAWLPNSVGGLMDIYDVDISFSPDAPLNIRQRQPGEIVPDLNNRGQGFTRMGPNEQRARVYGVRSLPESRELQGIQAVKEKEPTINDAKTRLIDQAVDSVTEGDSRRDIGELVQKAIELGMTPDQFMQNMMQAIKNKELTKAERLLGLTPNTLNRLQKREEVEEFRR